MLKDILRIAQKEWTGLFSSFTAVIFLGVFLAATLFSFFWVETFFARNIADVRPLFEWMPILLIFLMSAVTMRMWSEERRLGTLETLMTLPVTTTRWVLGKFLTCWALAATALALTLPLPFTVGFMGPLDWGPVIGGYVAALFLAGMYAAVGLYVSSKTDSQMVSLLVSVLAGAAMYVVGSDALTGFIGNRGAEILRLLGTGARFESITRGVLDIRDIYYYASVTAVFLTLNVYALETLRWSTENPQPRHTRARVTTVLLCVNFLVANLWLHPISFLRWDMTEGKAYSVSSTTKSVISQLKEPLLIRGYFSKKTHPLLAPLVPQIRDLLKEYEGVARGRLRVEFIDPMEHPELEKEAGDKYGIKAVPFQVADKYQAGLVNSFFNILISYGDKFEVLGFDKLIEVKQSSETKLDVKLRNPEYDITRAIKKALQSYQGSADLFSTIQNPVSLTGFISPEGELPKVLAELKPQLEATLNEIQKESTGKFKFGFEDPRAEGGARAVELAKKFGVQPLRASLFDPQTFYFTLLLQSGEKGEKSVMVPLPQDISAHSLRQGIEAGLKRFSAGFLRTVGIVGPPPQPQYGGPEGYQMRPERSFDLLKEKLGENFTVTSLDLQNGLVPDDTDVLMLTAPKDLSEKQVFAVDQFLMKGGTVVILSSPFGIKLGPLGASPQNSGLSDWLNFQGISIKAEFVMDAQNTPFPVPVERRMGMFVFQDIKMMNYPYFIDVRGAGMAARALTSGIPQVTLHWASPVLADKEKNKGRTVTELLKSSPKSWTSDSPKISPQVENGQISGFSPSGTVEPKVLATALEGEFTSFFKDKQSPLIPEKRGKDEKETYGSIIEKSAASARLIVFGSSDFLSDELLRFTSSVSRSGYTNSLQLAENLIDWSLEDRGLLAIRGRGQFARLLVPMSNQARMFWEYFNDALALAGVGGLWLWARSRRKRAQDLVAARFAKEG